MLSYNTKGIEKMSDINDIVRSDSIDNQIFIFDDIKDLVKPLNPVKLQMPIFAVCIQGWAKMEVNLIKYEIPTNTLVTLLPDHIIHGYELSDDFKGLFVGVTPGYGEEIMPDIHTLLPFVMNFKSTPVVLLTEEEVASITEFHAFLWSKIKNVKGFYGKKIVHQLLQALLYETLNIYKSRNNIDIAKRTRNEEIFYNFFMLVEHKFKVDRSVAYYADKLCITPKHLSSVVKIVSGRTAGEWIDNYVVLASKVMLRSSSLTIQEISTDLNFANQSFFGKYFKHHVGLSPSEYRKGIL